MTAVTQLPIQPNAEQLGKSRGRLAKGIKPAGSSGVGPLSLVTYAQMSHSQGWPECVQRFIPFDEVLMVPAEALSPVELNCEDKTVHGRSLICSFICSLEAY